MLQIIKYHVVDYAIYYNESGEAFDETIIEKGVKIAPSTHIGHNNHIGKGTVIICSQL